jgi:hypothetical protein
VTRVLKIAFSIMLIFALAVGSYFGFFYTDPDIKYIGRITSLKVPIDADKVQSTESDFAIAVKFIIQRKDVKNFTASNSFSPFLKNKDEMRYAGFATILLDSINRPVINDSDKYGYINDCQPGNAWQFLLNESTGELWVFVEFPDFKGHAPPCDKNRKL